MDEESNITIYVGGSQNNFNSEKAGYKVIILLEL